jgi:Protein of unknown function (DUF1580)
MIDPLREELMTPKEATKLYPRNAGGKRPHISAVYRHMSIGCHGVILESLLTPRRVTSREAIARFFRRMTELAQRPDVAPVSQPARSRVNRAVECELDRLGI